MITSNYNFSDCYVLTTGEVAGSAGGVMFDLFNATGGQPPQDVVLLGLYAIPKTDVAVSGVVSARFDVFRTRSAGGSGTGHSYQSSATNALNISPFDTLQSSLPSQISARQAPTQPVLNDWLQSTYVFPEETSAAAIAAQGIQLLPDGQGIPPFVLHPGQGLVVMQGTVASVNSYVFKLIFGLAESNKPL